MSSPAPLPCVSRAALVHEWFTVLAGSERVVEQLCLVRPELDLYALYADPSVVANTSFVRERLRATSFIQHLPGSATRYRSFLPLMPLAVEQLDLSGYELVLSSNHAVAKGVLTGPDQLHISYVHSPMRYAWDLQHQYLREAGLERGFRGWLAKAILHQMRIWDCRTAAGVDHFVANSHFIKRRIHKVYRRRADVIYPPVDVDRFAVGAKRDSYYLAASRLVPYKKMDLIVRAFRAMPDRRLVVIGDGPEAERVKREAAPNIELLGYQPFDVLRELMQRARAFVFAAEEDFGIIPVEAQACGTPVIAFGKGGALETVRGLDQDSPTGVFFGRQDAASLIEAVRQFERHEPSIEPAQCRRNAERFSAQRFRQEFSSYLDRRLDEFHARTERPETDAAEAASVPHIR